jgi:hypothetical protein
MFVNCTEEKMIAEITKLADIKLKKLESVTAQEWLDKN